MPTLRNNAMKTGQLTNFLPTIRKTDAQAIVALAEVGVTDPAVIEKARIIRGTRNVTKARLDLQFGTAKAIEKEDDDDSDEELYFKFEKDKPAGAILKFVANKYLALYFPANGRVA